MNADTKSAVPFQFHDAQQQQSVAMTGMWVFLATELMMFGALFLCYSIYRMSFARAFAAGSNDMDLTMGAINTLVLLGSSLTMALAVLSLRQGREFASVMLLSATMLLGSAFLVIKFMEYYHHWQHAKVPGFRFAFEGTESQQVEMFFLFYFIMTGLHAIHMIIGIGLLSVMFWLTLAGTLNARYYTPVENMGFYWHFVDIVWVFLFPLFYLVGRHLH